MNNEELIERVIAAVPKPGRIPFTIVQPVTTDTEAAFVLPAKTVHFTLQCRTAVDLRTSYDAGKVDGTENAYYTVKAGTVYYEQNLELTSPQKLYVSAASAVVVELHGWRSA